MNSKRSKGRFRLLRALILGSIMLLLVFLGYWLHARYRSEQDVLKKDLTVKLEAAQQDVSDSLVMIKVIIPAMGNQQFTIHRNLHPGIPDPGMRMTMIADDSFSAMVIPGSPPGKGGHSSIKSTRSLIRKIDYNIKSDTTNKRVMHGLNNVLRRSGVFSDSFQRVLLGTDSVLLKKAFRKKLVKGGYRFDVEFLNRTPPATTSKIVLPLSEGQSMLVTGFRPYLAKKIVPDVLFALLLLSITSIAFWLTLRSLRQQMRLSLIRNELVSNMSHELKTPVSTVKVALEALSDPEVLADRSTVNDYVSMAALEINRLELLINQSLHTSLLEEGKLLMQPHPADLQALASQVARTMDIRFRQQGAILSFSAKGEDFMANVDSLHLQGVILNMLDNALKYGGENVAVSMVVSATPSAVIITIRDNGPGIPPAYIGHVFDKFFRVPTQNLHDVKGYGLGLSYAAQVIQQHRGTVSVKNNEEGRGVTFTITIPKHP